MNSEKSSDGTLPGFKVGGIRYWWNGTQYVQSDTDTSGYKITDVTNKLSSVKDKWMYFFYDKKNSCGSGTYVAVLISDFLSSGKTIKEFSTAYANVPYGKDPKVVEKGKKELIGCTQDGNNWNKDEDNSSSGGTGGNGLKSINDLYSRRSTGDGKTTDDSKDVVDYTGRFTAAEIQIMLGKITSTKSSTGIKGKVFITDENTATSVLEKVQARYNQPEAKEMVIWLNVDSKTKKFDIKINAGSGLPEWAGKSTKEIERLLSQNKEWIDDFWLMDFNPLTAILDGLAELITKAKIPERYYNPDNTDYNPFPAKIYSYVSLKVINDELNSLAGSPMGDKYTSSRIDFAFVCGVWNGLVGTAAAIPEGGSFLIKMITNEKNARSDLAAAVSKIQWKDVKEMVGEQWNKYTANPCMMSYGAGEVTFVVASCFIGAGEIKGATAVIQTMEKLDVMGQMIGKFAKFTGRFVIKPVVSKAGKFIIEPLIKLEPAISQKLRSNVSKYVAQLLNKDKIHLSLHATSDGKFIVDGLELSPEEFGEYITKKLKEAGNANKNIVLLSCNDFESAKALVAVTGKKVYTTDGPMTIFENGIRRADGSEWYEINPDGTSTKIQSPVTECVNCSGNGVTMGAYFSIKKYLNNISDDLATKIENLIPWIKTLDINIGSVEEDVVGDIKAIKVVKDKAKVDRAYNIVKSEQEATNFLIKKFDAKYLETKYITDRYTGKQLELKVYLTGKDESHVLLVRKDLPDIPENLVGGGVNKEHFNFGEFSLDQFDDVNLENNKLHEHIIWTD